MTGFLIAALLVLLASFVVYVLASDPDWLRAQAKAERDLYAARRSRQLNDLQQAIRRDAERLRDEIDDEFGRGP